ncbi:site-specific DNA-methyltransferase [Streptococcus marmotae]|uniref:site-specific DNA-methyltransferase n=1 Tax=Streptococcus marmotae TaxID=1825069 RepID=UPI000ACDDD05
MQQAINFDKLKDLLSHQITEGRETYEFTWVGKRTAMAEAAKPTSKTLRPDLDESVDFEKSSNVFITGDNLEVLKILQESYLGKIDMIYIDPPYNTGKDFVYSDKFQKTQEELDDDMGLRDEEGRQVVGLTKNEKSSARYHSDWLNMMYPRLRLARNLLKDSGVIFISIDDNEQANLKALCDEIFGEENFVANLARKVMEGGKSDSKGIAIEHEYCLVYLKKHGRELNKKTSERLSHYNKKDDFFNERGYYYLKPLENGGLGYVKSLDYPIQGPDGQDIYPGGVYGDNGYRWVWGRAKFLNALELGMIEFVKSQKDSSKYKVYYKIYEKVDTNGNKSERTLPYSSLYLDGFTNRQAVNEIKKLFNNKRYFDYPKPSNFIKEAIKMSADVNSLVLDFFAGSATTADAVMQLNAEDGGNRKYILCTLDEAVADKSPAKEAGFETIDQISRERIRRAAAKIRDEQPDKAAELDLGFKAYRLDSSNFKDVTHKPGETRQQNLFDEVSNIKEGRSDLDILLQVMLSWGLELSDTIEKRVIEGVTVYDVAEGGLLATFSDHVPDGVIRVMAQEKPLRAIFRDSSFKTSAEKINLTEIFKELSPSTKVKVV